MDYELEIDGDLIRIALEEIRQTVEWGPHARAWYELKNKSEKPVKFRKAFNQRLLISPFGVFLQLPDRVPLEDRETILDWLRYQWKRSKRKFEDLICDQPLDLISTMLKVSPIITTRVIMANLTCLRLIDCGITEIDASFKMLIHVRILNLSANWIKDLPGGYLPRTLAFLEMAGNELTDLNNLVQDFPRTVIHLGLSRNRLIDGISNLPLLCGTFIASLDLGGNDFEDLLEVLTTLSSIKHLKAICLEDNPCSMCYLYKEAVLSQLPDIHYLDFVRLTDEEKELPDDEVLDVLEDYTRDGTLCFYCYRIMGLEQPKKNEVFNKKKLIQNFQLEIDLPLFDPTRRLNRVKKNCGFYAEEEKEEDNALPINFLSQRPGSLSKPRALLGPEEDVEEGVMRFKTMRFNWGKIMQFPAPCIRIRTSHMSGLRELRDTFRSDITVRLYYLKTLPPEKPAKAKKKKKGSPGSPPKGPPKETIVAKTLLAKFKVPLESVSWADRSLDYSFVEKKPDVRPEAKLVPGFLSGMAYKEIKGKQKAPKKGATGVSAVAPIPNALTIHVGFGLQRQIPDPVRDHIPDKATGKAGKAGKKK